jgi:hypothetical protein
MPKQDKRDDLLKPFYQWPRLTRRTRSQRNSPRRPPRFQPRQLDLPLSQQGCLLVIKPSLRTALALAKGSMFVGSSAREILTVVPPMIPVDEETRQQQFPLPAGKPKRAATARITESLPRAKPTSPSKAFSPGSAERRIVGKTALPRPEDAITPTPTSDLYLTYATGATTTTRTTNTSFFPATSG